MRKAFIRFLWGALAVGIIATVIGFFGIWFGFIGYMPGLDDLQNPINRSASQIYSSDGQVMGTYNFDRENRICVSYNNLSPHLVRALVSTEDERFYMHSGIDFKALGRAIIKRGILGRENAGGGSTITQQLAKQLYSEKAHSKLERLLQKPIEWVIAIKLERYYTKEEIIAQGIVSAEDYAIMEDYTRKIFSFFLEIAAKRGLILVDTKYEFGKRDGKVYLIDEIHTPDSSRYFYADGYEEKLAKGKPQRQLSKEFVRQWLIEHNFMNEPGQTMPEITDEYAKSVSDRYIELYEHIVGEKFERETSEEDIAQRIEKNVSDYLKNHK